MNCRLLFTIITLGLSIQNAASYTITCKEPGKLEHLIHSIKNELTEELSISKEKRLTVNGYLSKEDVHFLARFCKTENLSHLNLAKAEFREIGMKLFENCQSLVCISLPSSVRTIAKQAFANCTSLEKMHIPRSTTSVGTEAFSNCTNLRKLIYHKKLTWIGENAFMNCPLKTIKAKRNKEYLSKKSHIYNKNGFIVF